MRTTSQSVVRVMAMSENYEDKSDNIIPCEKISIKGKGSGRNYSVYIDGKKVNNCRAVGFYVDASSVGVVQLEIYGDEVEIEMEDGVVLKKNAFDNEDDEGEEGIGAEICDNCGAEFNEVELLDNDIYVIGKKLCVSCARNWLNEERSG